MSKTDMDHQKAIQHQNSHIPKGSLFFERIVPVFLILMAIVMLLLVLFAAGVLLGLVQF